VTSREQAAATGNGWRRGDDGAAARPSRRLLVPSSSELLVGDRSMDTIFFFLENAGFDKFAPMGNPARLRWILMGRTKLGTNTSVDGHEFVSGLLLKKKCNGFGSTARSRQALPTSRAIK
jgi:hypothetical protein